MGSGSALNLEHPLSRLFCMSCMELYAALRWFLVTRWPITAVDVRRTSATSQVRTLNQCSPSGSLGLGTGHSRRFRFFRNRNLSQSPLKTPDSFALGSSETFGRKLFTPGCDLCFFLLEGFATYRSETPPCAGCGTTRVSQISKAKCRRVER